MKGMDLLSLKSQGKIPPRTKTFLAITMMDILVLPGSPEQIVASSSAIHLCECDPLHPHPNNVSLAILGNDK
jgi:hypothetical protein